ncbi:hypothetical protein ACFQDN_21765 [Pseudomonas asuensis]|uniref:Uncharacterized protein n=1 Tax=Pseudomonas asuensis TaxID=1825787 RepID=A0ABQ2H2W7_9PSED|nr:hypothetical protein [Pseudomonas asuensis]GGM25165.1 hypothetical protein GCM10009425_39990 [Pseudomonas asuensis]
MSATITQLEQTLITQARLAHEQVAKYYEKVRARKHSGADYDEYLKHYYRLSALLYPIDIQDSGLTEAASHQLRGIDAEHQVLYRQYAYPNVPDDV